MVRVDSVPTSNGVTDNGMGVVTALEMMRYFIEHPPRNTIIFLFNNFEEGGLLGCKTFIHHPWYASVKLFINLGNVFHTHVGSFFFVSLTTNILNFFRGCRCRWKSHDV